MSHFTRMQTQMVAKEFILQALKDLGYQPQVGNVEIRGFGGKRTPVEVKIPTQNPAFEIGFQKAGSAYELVADWWGIHEIDPKAFQQQIAQRYAYHAAIAKLAEQGFTLAGEEQQADGRIHLTLRRIS